MQDSARLRVMSFNILFETDRVSAGPWEERRPLVSRLIREWAPDIVGVQEAMEGQLADLSSDFPEYGMVTGVRTGQSRMPFWAATVTPALAGAWLASLRWRRRDDSAGKALLSAGLLAGAAAPAFMTVNGLLKNGRALVHGSYPALFYRRDRFRLVRDGIVEMSESVGNPATLLLGTWLPRVANWIELEPHDGGLPFMVYNAHVDWMPWGPKTSGRKLRAHMDQHWTGAPQVLLGDFNGDLDCDACRELTRPGPIVGPPPLVDAWDITEHREGPDHTCDGPGGLRLGSCPGRTDHILVRSGFHPERVVTVQFSDERPAPSDHFPVIADLCPAGKQGFHTKGQGAQWGARKTEAIRSE